MYFPLTVARAMRNPERNNVARVIEMVARHRPTFFFAVPTFYAAVLREADGPATAWIFLQYANAYQPVKRCRRKSSTRGSGDSESKFWTELARRRCCTCSSPAVRGMQAGELRFPRAGLRSEDRG